MRDNDRQCKYIIANITLIISTDDHNYIHNPKNAHKDNDQDKACLPTLHSLPPLGLKIEM